MDLYFANVFRRIKQNACRSRVLVRNLAFVLWVIPLYACAARTTPAGPSAANQDIQDIVVHRPLSERAQYVREGEINAPSHIMVGWVRPEDRNTPIDQLPQNIELRIAEGEPLSLDLVLFTGQDATFLVTLLVDYKQTPFRLDGKTGLLHEYDVEAGKELYIPIQVDIDGAGAHDLTLVAFRDPYQRPMDHDFRKHQWQEGRRHSYGGDRRRRRAAGAGCTARCGW